MNPAAATEPVLSPEKTAQFATLAEAGERGALLVVDVQRSFGDPEHLARLDERALAEVAAAVDGTIRAVEAARAAGIEVVWIQLTVAPDDPWRSSNWLRGIAAGDPWPNAYEPCVVGTPGIEWYRVEPEPGESVVPKRTYDGFFRTDLDDLLRAKGVTWVTVVGLTTDCCVFMTAASAFSHGYPTVVVSDATGAYENGLHDASLNVLSLHSAVVATLDEISTVWASPAAASEQRAGASA